MDSTTVEAMPKRVPRIRRILVPLDGGAYAERALSVATGLARVCHAEIVLLHVGEQQPTGIAAHKLWALPHLARDTVHEMSLYLARQESTLRGLGVRVQSRLVRGEPGEIAGALARTCKQMRIDLLVLTTHALEGSTGKAVASAHVAAVLGQVSLPVLLVSNTTGNPFALSRGKGIQIFVPQGQEDTGAEIAWAEALARVCDGQVVILQPVEASTAASAPVNSALPSCIREERPHALEAPRNPVSAWWADGDTPTWAAVASGHFTTELVRQARGRVAVIVLPISAVRDQRPVRAALEVLRQSEAPVLMIPTGAPATLVVGLCECGKLAR